MPSGVELATAYVSVVGETSQLRRDVEDVFGRGIARSAERAGAQAGTRFTQGFNDNTDDLGEGLGQRAGGDTGDGFVGGFGDKISGLSDKAGPIGAALTAAAVLGLGAGKLLADQVAAGMETLKDRDLVAARLGLDDAAMTKVADAAGKAYANNFGESVQSNLEAAQRAIQGGLVTDAADPGLQKVIEQLTTVNDVVDGDLTGTTKAASILMRTYGISAQNAFDVITHGYVKSGDLGDDLVDSISEYSSGWKNTGLSAEQALALIQQSVDMGVDNTDRGADALREFGRRVTEEGPKMIEALNGIGLNGQQMYDAFKTGGPDAFAAFDQAFDTIRGIQDPVQRNAAAMSLLGDTAGDFIGTFAQWDPSAAVQKFGTVAGAAQKAADQIGSNTASSVETARRSIEQAGSGIQVSLAQAFGPALESAASWVTEHQGDITDFFTTAANAGAEFGAAITGVAGGTVAAFGQIVRAVGDTVGWVLDGFETMSGAAATAADALGMSDLAADLRTAQDRLGSWSDSAHNWGQGMVELGEGMVDASLKMHDFETSIGNAGTAASATTSQLGTVHDQLAQLPPNTPITITPNTDDVASKLAEAGLNVKSFKDANGQIQLSVTANGQAAIDELGRVHAEAQILIAGSAGPQRGAAGQDTVNPGRVADERAARNGQWLPYDPSAPPPPRRASGGPINGPGPKGKDSVLMYGAPGEHMWTDSEVDAVGGHQNMYALRAAALAGAIPGWDDGGPISQDEWLKRMMQGQNGTELPNEGSLGFQLNRFGGVGRDRPEEVRGNFNPDMKIDTSTSSLAPSYGVNRDFGGGLPWFYSDIEDAGVFDAKERKSYENVVLPRKRAFDEKDPFGGLLGYETGGEIRSGGGAYAAIDEAFNQSGQAYQYGTFDCSMYMSQIYAAMAGLPQGQRYFTTESDFEALGFKKGYKPGALNVGIRRGGGGPNSHMAGTLPNAINVENSSNGSLYGDGAAGADTFPIQYYYEPPMAGDMGAMQSQSMGQAAGGFNEMQELGAALGGYGSASEASAAGAPIGGPTSAAPTRTEGYIPAGAGNTSVAGTSFLSGVIGMGGEAIKGAIDAAASAGSGAANAFAPGAGMAVGIGADIAKQGVDYGVKMAGIGVDALIEQLTPFGAPRWLSTDPTAFMPQARGLAAGTTTAETAVNSLQGQQSAVNPATTVHGQGMGAAPGPVAPPVAPGGQPTPGMSAIGATQPMTGGTTVGGAPVTSTTQDWIKRIGIFDQGGVLEPGPSRSTSRASPKRCSRTTSSATSCARYRRASRTPTPTTWAAAVQSSTSAPRTMTRPSANGAAKWASNPCATADAPKPGPNLLQ